MLWSILLCAVAILLIAVVLVVALPIRVRATWQSDPVPQGVVQLRPFGGVSPPIRVYDSTRRTADKPDKAPRKEKPAKAKRKRGMKLRRLRLSDVTTLLRQLMQSFHLETLRLDAEFGLGDPADTGQVFGQLTPLIYATGADLRLRPNFAEACLRGTALLQFRFTLFGLIWPFIRFAWRVLGPVR